MTTQKINELIQEIISITLTVNGVDYNIPLLGEPARMPNDKLVTADGHDLWGQ